MDATLCRFPCAELVIGFDARKRRAIATYGHFGRKAQGHEGAAALIEGNGGAGSPIRTGLKHKSNAKQCLTWLTSHFERLSSR